MKKTHLTGTLFVIFTAVIYSFEGCNRSKHVSLPNSSTSDHSSSDSLIAFTDITKNAGLKKYRHETGAFGKKYFPETFGAGCGFLDFNKDGWLDIVLVGGGIWPASEKKAPSALLLFRNNRDGTFTNVTKRVGLANTRAYGFGVTVADYDNDGDQDIFLTALHKNMLFRNDRGIFKEIGEKAGLANHATFSTAALFFDADRDGDLDLYVGGYCKWSPETDVFCSFDGKTKAYCTPEEYEGVPGHFYSNNGDGTFTECTKKKGFGNEPGKTLGVAELDYNRDGWPDVIVANDQKRNLLYENNGDGSFTEKGKISGIAFNQNGGTRAGMGVDVGVVDSTGEETIFIGNFSREMIGVFRHVGKSLFVDRATSSRIGYPSLLNVTFGLFLFDVDLDGDLDLFTANGHLQKEVSKLQNGITYRERPQLFLNRGDGVFREFVAQTGDILATPLLARGAAYGDIDHDGDLDVLIVENGGHAHLWRNDERQDSFSANNFLRVDLQGMESNRDGIGSKVVVIIGDKRLERRMSSGSSYLSQPEKTVTFGLEKADRIDTLGIYWSSGQIDHFLNVKANQEISVEEGNKSLKRLHTSEDDTRNEKAN